MSSTTTVADPALAELLEGLSTEERQELAGAADIALARRELLPYCQLIDPTYRRAPHIEAIADVLEAVERNEQQHAIITMPPRHGKSELVSGKFPGWCLGRDPNRRVILSSYGAQLAETFSVQNRDTVAVNPMWPLVFPGVSVSATVRSQTKWALHGQRESVIAAGVGGAVTGFGAWLFVIDDPIKNFEEAVSQALRDKHWDWYRTVARTRLTPDGHIVLIMTRWHEDDLAGRILNGPEATRFKVLHMPAESYGAPEDYANKEEATKVFPKRAFPDPLGRPKGAALWPDLYNATFLREARDTLGHEYEALYQGNPTAPTGDLFERGLFRAITQAQLDEVAYRPISKIRSWDLAWSESRRADYTVGTRATLYQFDATTASKKHPTDAGLPMVAIVLEDVVRGKWEWPGGGDQVVKAAAADTEKYRLLVEAVAAQSVAVKSIRKDPRMWKHTVMPISRQKDKLESAQYIIKLASRGSVFILYPNATTPPPWEHELLKEIADFPYGANDDQVDTLSQLGNHWQPVIDGALLVLATTSGSADFVTGGKVALPEPFRTVTTSPRVDGLCWLPNHPS
jgi:phage terminase large subunit-like protein